MTQNNHTIPEALRAAFAAMHGDPAESQILQTSETSDLFPISAALKEAQRIKAATEHTPGELIEGEGIFLCRYQLHDHNGNPLKKIFNVFVAPEDLTSEKGEHSTLDYLHTVERVAALKDWNGHDGGNYPHQYALYKALLQGTYQGEWVIPPREIMDGDDLYTQRFGVQKENMCRYKDTGTFKGTYLHQPKTTSSAAIDWYWSCTEEPKSRNKVWNVRFNDETGGWNHKDTIVMSCRPIRFVEVTS